MVPGLEERLMSGDIDEVHACAAMVYSGYWAYCHLRSELTFFLQLQRGASGARSDDTKSLKSAIIDWLSPPGEPLRPPIARNIKTDRGFNHEVTGALLCPVGVDWSDLE